MESSEDNQNKRDKIINICRYVNLCLSFFALGLCIAIPGPTLLDLQNNVNTDTKYITIIYTVRAVGVVVGSLLGGILFDIFNRQFLFIVFITISGLTTFAVPWCSLFSILATCLFISGVGLGAIDAGGNVWCLDLWQEKSGPFMQALHFTFGFGAFVAPLIAEPFLSPLAKALTLELELGNNQTMNETIELINQNLNVSSNTDDSLYIINAYAIISGYVLLVAVAFTVIFIIQPEDVARHTVQLNRQAETSNAYKYAILFVAIILFVFLCGMESSFGQMLTTFAVKGDLKLTKSIGSFMTSVYWGTFTFARGLAIIWSTQFSPFSLIVFDLVIINIAGLLLAGFGNTVVEVLWLGTALLGFGMSPMYPAIFAWIERYVSVSNKVAAIFVVSGAVGEMIMPLIVGFYTDIYPEVLMYISCGACSACLICFVIMWKMAAIGRNSYSCKKNEKMNGEIGGDKEEENPLNGKRISDEICESET